MENISMKSTEEVGTNDPRFAKLSKAKMSLSYLKTNS
jgi:hypothetical protein